MEETLLASREVFGKWSCRVLMENANIYIYIFFLQEATLKLQKRSHSNQWRTEGGFGVFKRPPSEILKALQNRAKLNPIVKTVKNC